MLRILTEVASVRAPFDLAVGGPPDPWVSLPGYYRTLDGWWFWDGMAWTHRYWRWWRVALTVLTVAACLMWLFAAWASGWSPGMGGETSEWVRAQHRFGIEVLVLPPIIGVSLAATHLGLHRFRTSTKVMEKPRRRVRTAGRQRVF